MTAFKQPATYAFIWFSLISGSWALFHSYASHAAIANLPDVIYGDDNRRDLFEAEVSSDITLLAESTALLTSREHITDSSDPYIKNFSTKSLREWHNLCDSEPFADQPVGGWCSGFLAAPDILVTAGHCASTPGFCEEVAFVFGYSYAEGGEDLNHLQAANVYGCKEVIAQKYESHRGYGSGYGSGSDYGSDYAVIRLDRPVRGRKPLPLRRYGKIETGAELVIIGHPSGLPTKIADGASVRSNNNSAYFVTNTDSYGGNSGSPVFNAKTGVVEGILVRGEQDYREHNGCLISNVCLDNSCRGEDVTRATLFASYLN